LKEIGELFLQTREAAGVSLKEVSEDLGIEEAILTNIEDGKTGAFSDIFVLKNYVTSYAKYLGLDETKVVDQFNEYVFEETSKIPIRDIEKQIEENNKNDNEPKIMSPYTRGEKKIKNGLYLTIYIILIMLLVIAVIWSVKQIAYGTKSAYVIGNKE
jgi:cytoskeletal protein RodZ